MINKGSIRNIIFGYFTVSALVMMSLAGLSLYNRLSSQLADRVRQENQAMINLASQSVDYYLRNIMKLSDSLYYRVIKNADLSEKTIDDAFTLLYDSHKVYISNIALMSGEGELVTAVPAARLKTGVDVTQEDWFRDAMERTEDFHFSMPHVQYIFDSGENQYRWVISLARAVEITKGAATGPGVLLIDISYESLQQLLDSAQTKNEKYLYLLNKDGELIYHPRIQLIDAGLAGENIEAAAGYEDGSCQEIFLGEKRDVAVKTVGYPGWKVVGVTPKPGFTLNRVKTGLFLIFIVGLFLFLLFLINSLISSRITAPIQELERSVNAIEEGELDTEVSIGGSYEIQHLGRSIGEMAQQIQQLMQDIVTEHESKQKSEFDTLQSQINPHFLYNTLDIIVWMIENEQKAEAVRVVTALARFFRISLSKGKSIISVGDELEHARSYLMIQQMRFKNKFTYTIDAEPEVLKLASLKLILQPFVENAIYYGMESMDGDGEIVVKAGQEDGCLIYTVEDNGLGMTQEQVDSLLTEHAHGGSGRGSGIGVKNVNERIRLYFGEEYGLTIWSEPDEGTKIRIRLPMIPYEELAEKEKV